MTLHYLDASSLNRKTCTLSGSQFKHCFAKLAIQEPFHALQARAGRCILYASAEQSEHRVYTCNAVVQVD